MLHPLDPFFILIYEGSKWIRVRRNGKEGSTRYLILDGIENDNNLSSYCGGLELTLILVGVKVEVEWRSKHESSKSSGYQNRYLN